MIYTNTRSSFPDQVVPQEEKMSLEYGLLVGRAIEGEWWSNGIGGMRYSNNYNIFHNRRLYARGEQSIKKYKDEMSINGDLSYLNLDWKPVPILPKFVDIVVNGMSEKIYDIKAYAQDPASQKARTDYATRLHKNITTRAYMDNVKAQLGIDISQVSNREKVPENEEELELHMQLDYKQSIEIAEEELISTVLARNKFDLTRRRFNKDIVEIGMGAVKTTWNKSEGIVVDYVDPASLVWSYTEDPNFEDIYYVGEVKSISLPELKKEFPNLTDQELEEIQKYPGTTNYVRNWESKDNNNTVQVLYFEYKTYADQVFKIKKTAQGLQKAIEKPDTFNPEESDNFERVSRSIEVLYSGAKILGHPIMLEWKVAENMTRPFSNLTKVNMNYQLVAPSMYKGRINSLVERMMPFADMIQLTSLKLQQVLSRMVPDGVYLDVDGLAEVDSQAKIQSLIQTYQYYLQMIRDVTGLNEARDGSMPDKDSLLGLQKLAVAQSNVATRNLLDSSLYLVLRACENISLRVADSLEFDLTNEALVNSISLFNVATLEEIKKIHLYDFGIFLELEPDDEEKAKLEENIQLGIKTGGLDVPDAIDIREIKNLKLANQLLKLKREQKAKADQAAQQQMIEAQAKANAEAAEKAAMAEVQKQQALAQTQLQIEQGKSQFEIQRMQTELQIKMQLADQKFGYDMQLEQARIQKEIDKEALIEDRKDKRIKLEGTQQSQMIAQRQDDLLPIDFGGQDLQQPVDMVQPNQSMPPMQQ